MILDRPRHAALIEEVRASGARIRLISDGDVYGAIATAGEWGLKKGCAVAYTDKGSGNGGHDLAANTAYSQLGVRGNAGSLGTQSIFTAAGTDAERAAFNSSFPNRWAYKHAHSQQNPEKDWGNDTLNAVRFAFYVLNEQFAPKAADGSTTVRFLSLIHI